MVQDLYVLMITAAVVSIVFKFLKQPVVLGYIVAGVLVGPHLFGETLVNEENVKAWGGIGVLFVLFCIGLEFRLKNLISSGKVAAVGALTIILGMMLLGYWVGQDAELDMVNSLFLAGIILALGLCLGMVLTAEEAGFSSALGAFVMGSILAETVESHRIEKLMTPLKNVFAAIFFISVGMLINPASLPEYWVSIAYVSLGVLNSLIYPIIVASSVVTTFLTKRLVNLFIKNMSAHDENA